MKKTPLGLMIIAGFSLLLSTLNVSELWNIAWKTHIPTVIEDIFQIAFYVSLITAILEKSKLLLTIVIRVLELYLLYSIYLFVTGVNFFGVIQILLEVLVLGYLLSMRPYFVR